MPQKSWAVGEEVLAADFNTYLQNQVVPAFTNVAQRDSQWAAPPNGAVCVTVDTGTCWQRIGGTWFRVFGRLGYNQRTTAMAALTAETTVGVDVTVTVPANRLIRLDAYIRSVNGSANPNGGGFVRIKEGATVLNEAQVTINGSNIGHAVSLSRTIQPTAAAHTYGLYVAGSGTVTVQADPTYPAWLEAWDMGPV